MKRVYISFLLLLNLNALTSLGQTTYPGARSFNANTPNVAELGKFIDYPVDLSTGVPKIDIPLYTVKSGQLTLPISLSYHASGIKIDQQASQIGLGWVLNAGGFIAKVVKDKPDDMSNGFPSTGSNLPNYNSIFNLNAVATLINDNSSDLTRPIESRAKGTDKEPDIYRIVSNVISDEFCLDNANNYVSLNLDSFKYSVNFGTKLITVKDRRGNTFRFGRSLNNDPAFESLNLSIETSTSSSIQNYISSFFLTEIISSDLVDTISFKYTSNFFSDYKVASSVKSKVVEMGPFDEELEVNSAGVSQTYLNMNIPDAQVLDKIIFKNGYIKFSNAADRLDMYSYGSPSKRPVRLTGFVVYDNRGSVLNSVQFDNSGYFERNASGGDIARGNISDERKKALKLNSVKFYDKNGAFVNDYKFNYDLSPLPARNTTPQDFWGYYNGKPNEHIIPEVFYTFNSGFKPQYYGVDRSADFNYMKAGILNKVIFPTGGYNLYEYEPNYYLDQYQTQNIVEQTQQVKAYAANKLSSCSQTFLPGAPANNIYDFTVTETLNNNGVDIAKLYVMFSDYVNLGSSSLGMQLTITDLTTGEQLFNFDHGPSGRSQIKVFNQDITVRKDHTYRFDLRTNGVTGSNSGPCNSPYIEAGINYKYYTATTQNQIVPKQGGGLRVKNITSYNFDNSLVTQKAYEYGDEKYGPNNIGVGTLITDPSKNFFYYPLLFTHAGNKRLYNTIWFSSESQVELGENHGCPVWYNKVTEKQVSPGTSSSNGKTEYFFDEPLRFLDPKSSEYFPYDTYTYPSWGSSSLVKEIYYSLSGNSYQPEKEIEYSYFGLLPGKRIKTLKLFEVEPEIHSASYSGSLQSWIYMGFNPDRFMCYNYFVSRGKKLKSDEITKNYVGGVLANVFAKTFEYDGYNELKKETLSNSKLENIETKFKYTSDLNYPNLVSKNMVSLPVQTEQVINGKVRSGSILKYNDDGQIIETYRAVGSVSSVAYSNISTVPPYYEKAKVFDYDAVSKLLKVIKIEKAPPTSYLWGYNKQYPIAEVKNAAQNEFYHQNFEGGEVDYDGSIVFDNTKAHTGKYSGRLTNPNTTEMVSHSTKRIAINQGVKRKFTFSGWVYSDAPSVQLFLFMMKPGETAYNSYYDHMQTTVKNKWTYMQKEFEVPADVYEVFLRLDNNSVGNVWFDDLRIQPSDSDMSTYTYQPLVGMTSAIDNSGKTVYYEYDSFQRLKNIKDQNNNIVKSFDYHYKQ